MIHSPGDFVSALAYLVSKSLSTPGELLCAQRAALMMIEQKWHEKVVFPRRRGVRISELLVFPARCDAFPCEKWTDALRK